MEEKLILQYTQSCKECMTCMDSCDTYGVTQDELKSPNGRLKISKRLFELGDISTEEIIGLYTCTLCSTCDLICPQTIPISEIIHSTKEKLVELNKGPLENHKKITKGIVENDNSVNGNPDERLEWIPDKYRNGEMMGKKEADTLLYLGCMSSFRVKESASASYEILKKADYNFKIMKNEPCCGEYVYSSGDINLAKKIFYENYTLFNNNNVKNLIVTCGGCLYAFNKIYPKYVKEWDISVKHIVQVIDELSMKGILNFKSLQKSITYHDSCRMGRKLDNIKIYNEPRNLIKLTNSELKELENNLDNTSCCGAGSGIRGVDSSISIKIGTKILESIETEEIVTSCPLCVFNFRYVNYKKQLNKTCRYITDYILDAID